MLLLATVRRRWRRPAPRSRWCGLLSLLLLGHCIQEAAGCQLGKGSADVRACRCCGPCRAELQLLLSVLLLE